MHFEPLMHHLPAWLLVLFRLTGIFLFAPLFGSMAIPGRVKIFLALGLSFCVYPMLLTPGSASNANLLPVINGGLSFWLLTSVVAMELAIGLVIGFGATLPLVGMQWGGRAIAQQIGLGFAEVLNPGAEQSGLLGQLLYLVAVLIFISPPIHGDQVLLRTLVDSFSSVPIGGFAVDGRVMELIIGLMTSMVHLALRVAAPLLCLIFLETMATGLIMRTVPQVNILSIGFAIRIMIGTTLLLGAININTSVFAEFMQDALTRIIDMFAVSELVPGAEIWGGHG